MYVFRYVCSSVEPFISLTWPIQTIRTTMVREPAEAQNNKAQQNTLL
jgi:hypothetical protein